MGHGRPSLPEAVIFDVDGVLVDAKGIHSYAFMAAVNEFAPDFTITDEEHDRSFNGLPTKEKLTILVDRGMSVDLCQRIERRKQTVTMKMLTNKLQVDESKVHLLTTLRAGGIKVMACSNALQATTDFMLKRVGIYHLLNICLGMGGGEYQPKPSPQIFQYAAARAGVSLDNCIIVEDSEVGINAALAANPMIVCKVEHPFEVGLAMLHKFF